MRATIRYTLWLSLFALQALGDRWLVWSPDDDDPLTPPIRLAAVLDEDSPMRSFPSNVSRIRSWRRDAQLRQPQTRSEINDIGWPKEQLLVVARLLDHLSPPDFRNPERFHEQKSALSHELRRLARWRPSA